MYYTFSTQGSRDLAALSRRMMGARVLLNDLSTTPCLAALGWMVGGPHLINVISENTYFALVNVDKLNTNRVKGAVAKKLIDSFFYAARTNIINSIDPRKWFQSEGVLHYLPPITQTKERARPSGCRWQGEAKGKERLFVAYFNPEFRNKEFIGRLKETAARHNANLYLVSEYAADWHADLADARTQIVRQDFGMATLVHQADLVITAAGLALPLQSYIAGTPQLVVCNRAHIEHARNAEIMRREGMAHVVDRWDEVVAGAGKALDQGQKAHPELPARTARAWQDLVRSLVENPSINVRGAMPMIRSFRQPLVAT
jgi:UDP:flavonoid glycosyltransferase YjiC (YdhE family)